MRRVAKTTAVLSALALIFLLAACNLSTAPDPSRRTLQGVPLVQIVSPLPNATYLEGVSVNIQALVQNAGPDISRLDFSVDGQVIASLAEPNSAGATSFSASRTWESAGVGSHSLDVTAWRSDGSASVPAGVTITVIGQTVGREPAAEERPAGANGEDGAAGQQQPQPTNEPDPSEPEPASDRPTGRLLRGAYVRSGPDTRFAPPIGSIAAGDEVELLALNIHKTWYKVRYYSGDGWIFGSLLEVSGNLDDLPLVYGPPLPEPTAIPVETAPTTQQQQMPVNLLAGAMRNTAGTITCNAPFRVEIDVANISGFSSPGGEVRFLDYATKQDGGRLEPQIEREAIGTFPPIAPGQTVSASAEFRISFHYKERHIMWAYINHNRAILETDLSDNDNHFTYVLEAGDCEEE